MKDGGGSFHLIAVNSENMKEMDKEKYRIMGAEIPPSQLVLIDWRSHDGHVMCCPLYLVP